MAVKTVDRFVLKDILSDGSAGTVYRAEEVLPGDNKRVVALKVLPPVNPNEGRGGGATERFFNEVKVLAQLAVHPHVVTIYAMGITDNYPWLAMEYASATLANKVGDEPNEVKEIVKVLRQVGLGLQAMHSLKPPLIHQDLKPENVLMDAVGNYKITDFSLATVVASNRTHGLATVRYAAPELLTSEFGKVGPATDLYALGHIAYELALGARQHVRQFPAVFEGNSTKEPPPNKWMMWHASINTKPAGVQEIRKEFPLALSEIIARLMSKPVRERYSSAGEMLEQLDQFEMVGQPMPAAPSGPVTGGRSAAIPVPPPPTTSPIPVPVESKAAAPAPPAVPAAANVEGPMMRYWVRARGKVTGPFDFAGLQKQAKQGAVSRFHQISTDQINWKGASEVEGLYGPTVV